MKNLSLFLMLFLCYSAQAQISLETNYSQYSQYISYVKMTNADYYIFPPAAGEVKVYNGNHSVYKTISVPLEIAGYAFQAACYVHSDRLFDSDNEIEFLGAYKNASNQYRLYLIQDNGTSGIFIEHGKGAYVVQTNSGSKLMVMLDNAGVLSTSVYSFSTPTPTVAPIRKSIAASPYPNPTTDAISLAYELPSGTSGTLSILDITGTVVRSYGVDGTFQSLLVVTGDLTPGMYSYSVQSAEGIQQGKSFVVQ